MSDQNSEGSAAGSEGGAPGSEASSTGADSPKHAPRTIGMRASDAEREQLISELNEHMVAGRLGTDELEERTQAAYAARTTSQLDELRCDLPPTSRQIAIFHKERRAHLTRRMIQETGGSIGLFGLCLAIWLIDGAQGQFWPVWVLIVVGISMARNVWALYGPAPDLDAVERHLDRERGRRRQRDRRRARELDR